MVNRRTLFAVLPFLVLSACATVGPNYHLPAKAIVNVPGAQGAFLSGTLATISSPLPDQWWQLFDDPVLTRLIEQALHANTDLRIAEANLQRNDALLAEARTGQQVSGGADLETSWAQQSAEAVMQHAQPPEHQIYNAGLSISAALEPDSQNSFAANGLLAKSAGSGTPGTDLPGVLRVMAPPAANAFGR